MDELEGFYVMGRSIELWGKKISPVNTGLDLN